MADEVKETLGVSQTKVKLALILRLLRDSSALEHSTQMPLLVGIEFAEM